ncbi:MAG: hypothetical protein JNK64_05015 [Myxococcales bacterium]|nr:hypothetical protein [Myxococcales bacterium]
MTTAVDVAPPWARFPTYERYTIGWRMGAGEDYMVRWWAFVAALPPDEATRRGYLRRHPPAPFTWAELVDQVLRPRTDGDDADDADDDDDGAGVDARHARRAALAADGLIAEDVAYRTWRATQAELAWPWAWADTPIAAARYWTRDLWFWSRHLAERRAAGDVPRVDAPPAWAAIAEVICGAPPAPIDPDAGLASLARGLAAGHVVAPWQAGLAIDGFADSYDDAMGYVDAFRLWAGAAFDDAPTRERYLAATAMPAGWRAWIDAQLGLG